MSVAAGRNEAAPKLITISSIKSRRDNHEVRVELFGDGHHNLLECRHVFPVTHALVVPADIDVFTQASICSAFVDSTIRCHIIGGFTGIEETVLVDVERDVQDVWVLIENVL